MLVVEVFMDDLGIRRFWIMRIMGKVRYIYGGGGWMSESTAYEPGSYPSAARWGRMRALPGEAGIEAGGDRCDLGKHNTDFNAWAGEEELCGVCERIGEGGDRRC